MYRRSMMPSTRMSSRPSLGILQAVFLLLVYLFRHVHANEIYYTIKEEVPIGTPIGNIARDSNLSQILSREDFQSLQFNILTYPDDDSRLFTIDSNVGVFRTTQRVDREALCRYITRCKLKLHVSAKTPSQQHFHTFDLIITVEDINDSSPTFTSESLTVTLDEDEAVLASIPILDAEDEDIGDNGLQRYTLKRSSEKFGLKVTRNLDDSLLPQLYVKSALDREKQPFYQVTVVALDGGTPQLSGELTVNITLRDVNDNAPHFLSSRYEVDVKESTPVNSPILQLEAEDEDVGINGRVKFRLGLRQSEESFRLFRVAPDTGHVVNVRSLIPYQNRNFSLIVEAVDGGPKPLSAQAVVSIHVIDSVNNAPTIRMTLPADSKVIRVNEKANPGFVVAHFIVEDSDTGLNGDVDCSLGRDDKNPWGSRVSDMFSVQNLRDSEFKVTIVNHLDRETTANYDVTVTCADAGSPALAASVTFSVIVEDANDNPPTFSGDAVRRVSVAENSKNDFIMRLDATDPDLNANQLVRYSLGNVTTLVSTYIHVNPTTGEVTTKRELDRELFSQLDFLVVAKDSGDPPLSATLRIVIDVLDQNDNYPRVPLGYSLAVPENRPPWTVVGQIEAIDPDLGRAGEVVYQLMSDNDATKLFNLTKDGLLRTLRSFDREHRDLYDINVLASDLAISNPKTNFLHIRIQIADDNDHAPEFRFPRPGNNSASTSTDATVNATVGYLSARDPDSGENGTLSYTIVNDGGLDILRVDHATGRIYTSRNLRAKDVGEHRLDVFVRDSGVRPLSSTGTLYVSVRLGNMTLAAQGSEVGLGRGKLIIIAAALVSLTLFVAVCVFLVLLRLFRRESRDRRLKYAEGLRMDAKTRTPSPDAGGVNARTAMCNGGQGCGGGSGDEEGTWRQYNKPSEPGGMTYDVEDDVILFKMKLAEQYRELEPEDKEPCVENSSRSTSIMSDAADGGASTDPRSPAAGSRLGTFHTSNGESGHHRVEKPGLGGGHTARGDKDKVWLNGSADRAGEEKQSSSSRDSGQGASEDSAHSRTSGNDESTSPEPVSTNGSRGQNIYARGDYSTKRGALSGFERPPLLKTFQSSGPTRNSPQRDGNPGGGGTFPSNKVRREFLNDSGTYSPKGDSSRAGVGGAGGGGGGGGGYGTNGGLTTSTLSPYPSLTSLKQVRGDPTHSPATSPASTLSNGAPRPSGSPGFPDKTRSSELYQKRAAKSNNPPGLDDTILKRLVINGRKGGHHDGGRGDDDGYCSNAPSGDSVRDIDLEGSFVNNGDLLEPPPPPPPPSSTPTPKDIRLCSEPPLSPYTKMSSLPPFTYPIQESSTAQRASPSAYNNYHQGGQNTIPKHLGAPYSNSMFSCPSPTNSLNKGVPSILSNLSRGSSSNSNNNPLQQKSPAPLFVGGNSLSKNSPYGLSSGTVKSSILSSPYNSSSPSSSHLPFTSGYPLKTTTTSPSSSLTSLNRDYNNKQRNLNPSSDSSLEAALRSVPGHHELMNDSLETQEDSNTTTTSGSYAIDEEDLCVDLPPPANVFV